MVNNFLLALWIIIDQKNQLGFQDIHNMALEYSFP
jgi:hypothetical protein